MLDITPMTSRVFIKHRILERTDDFFRWKIYLEAEGGMLEKIQKVEYDLDRSFTEPRVKRTDFRTKFEFESSSYASFSVLVKIFPRGKGGPVTSNYDLTLDRSNEEGVFVDID
jgi:transcription initiation factor IIF auxiliary subunit